MKKLRGSLSKEERCRSRHRSIIQICLSASLVIGGYISLPFAAMPTKAKNPTPRFATGINTKDSTKASNFTNEILIKVKSSSSSPMASKSAPGDADAILSAAISGYASFKSRHQVGNARPVIKEDQNSYATAISMKERIKNIKGKYAKRSARANSALATQEMDNIYKISVDTKTATLEDLAKELAADPSVEYAVPNQIYHSQYIPSDPLYSQQWSHTVTSAQAAWDIESGNPTVVVAVIDVGVDYNHEDLAANMQGGYDFVDIDTNYYKSSGYTLLPGEDYTQIDGNPMDYNGHGTHCAGIVAAIAGNGKGVSGVAPGVKIMPVRAGFSLQQGSDEGGALESDDIANAIRYAADNGADIISMSFGGGVDPVIRDAIAYAASLGVVLVAAAGNSETNSKFYPAAYDNVIAVAATAQHNFKAFYSNYGSWVDIAAPGGDQYADNQILSTVPKIGGKGTDPSGYRAYQGTSMACPYVAGAAALILSRNPTSTVDQITGILLQSVDAPAESNSYIGRGRINLLKAVTSVPVQGTLSITAPYSMQLIRENSTFAIMGTAQASSGTYRVSYGPGMYPTNWTLLSSGSASIVNGLLGQWNVGMISDGLYTLRISVLVGSDSLSTTLPVYVDKNIHAGWPQTIPVGTLMGLGYGNGATWADINNDGQGEIFLKSNLSVVGLKSDGTRLAGWPPIVGSRKIVATKNETVGPTSGDIDNDGVLEICAVYNESLYVWTPSGTAKPGFPIKLSGGGTFSALNPVQLADLDGNGTLELIVKSESANNSSNDLLEVFSYNGARFKSWPYEFDDAHGDYNSADNMNGFSFVDYNNDGFKEIIGLAMKSSFIPTFQTSVSLFIWNYDGTLKTGYPIELSNTTQNYNLQGVPPVVADIDNDGEIEIGFALPNASTFNYVNVNGIAKTGWPIVLSMPNSWSAILNSSSVVDLNNDKKLETIIVLSGFNYTNSNISRSSVYAFDSEGKVLTGWPVSIPGQDLKGEAIVADLDGDGSLDILVGNEHGAIYAWNKDGQPLTGFPKTLFIAGSGPDAFPSNPSVGDLDGDGKLELVASSNYGYTVVWDLDGQKIPGSVDWPQGSQNPKLNYLSDRILASKPKVSFLGSWVNGLTHAKETGSNRALIVNVHGENASANLAITSVKYGGQTMTKVVEKNQGTGSRSYTGSFILNEAGIAAATSGAIAVTWASVPSSGSSVMSAFLSNVNQTTLIGATATSGGDPAATVTTSGLANASGDMVFVAATAANNGTYTLNNGFTRGGTEQAPTWGDITAGYKSGTGGSETPSVTSSLSQRQSIIGYVVKAGSGTSVNYTLTPTANNGTITLNPAGGTYTSGTVVTARATPNSGYSFANWSGDLSGSTNPTTITMNSNKSITANFTRIPPAAPANLTVLSVALPSITINWENKDTYHDGFEVERADGAGAFSIIYSGSGTIPNNDNTFIDPNAVASHTYQYRVRVFYYDLNANVSKVYSEYSNVLTVSTTGANVSILGSWIQGFTHAKQAGTNRALVVMLYGEGSGNISASSVKYGGQTMTMVAEKAYLSGAYSYTGIFMLKEAGVAAASSSTISVTWASAPTAGFDAVSVFLANVNQTSSIDAPHVNAIVGPTITSPSNILASPGDMMIAAATAANNGTYTINNGFTRGIPETSASFGDITAIYKMGTGSSPEMPSVTSSISQRQTMVGFVVKK